MTQLEMLEVELQLLQENIQRMKEFREENKDERYKPCSSRVVGEFKHRIVALKSRLTKVSLITTSSLMYDQTNQK